MPFTSVCPASFIFTWQLQGNTAPDELFIQEPEQVPTSFFIKTGILSLFAFLAVAIRLPPPAIKVCAGKEHGQGAAAEKTNISGLNIHQTLGPIVSTGCIMHR